MTSRPGRMAIEIPFVRAWRTLIFANIRYHD